MAYCKRILKHRNQNDDEQQVYNENDIVEIETIDCRKYKGRISFLSEDRLTIDTSKEYHSALRHVEYNNIYEIKKVEE